MDDRAQSRVVRVVAARPGRDVAPSVVEVLARDPELGRRLSPRDFELASARCRARVVGVRRGVVSGWPLRAEPEPGFQGFLVLAGVMSRRVTVGGLGAAEVFGPGDLLRPWSQADDRLLCRADRWRVHDDVELAVLDRRFCMQAAAWPELLSALRDREVQRLDSLVARLLIAQTPRISDRVYLLLWHLAERWGRVGPDGVSVPLPLSRALLAELACTTRESVSRALTALAGRGLVEPTRQGFLLREVDGSAIESVGR